MRIVIISETSSENVGYATTCLPKALAALGHEVHLVASNAQIYYNDSFYKEVYEHFLGPGITECGIKQIDGYTLHRIPFERTKSKFTLVGLYKKLKELKPDVVQTFSVTAESTYQAALYKSLLGYKLFTANHVLASVFPAAQKSQGNSTELQQSEKENGAAITQINRKVNRLSLGYLIDGTKNRIRKYFGDTYSNKIRFINKVTHTCYPATTDAADIAIKFFGVPENKIKINILGVDTDIFKPIDGNDLEKERRKIREENGYAENDILCIYTGRFTEGKNPLCLAKAIEQLIADGKPYKALFIGYGPQNTAIAATKGCKILPFMNYKELAKFYRAADIGVWPRQESTSVLDASACGLPVVISDKVLALERKEGNGLTYHENDAEDMKNTLLLLQDKKYRQELGKLGIEKIFKNQRWLDIANRRVHDYENALSDG